MTRQTRRTFLTRTGTAAAGLAGVAGLSGSAAAETKNGWTTVASPTGKTIYGVVHTAVGPYAVGASGNVLARRADSWELVVEHGPSGGNNTLKAVDVTDDGESIWFDGGSGVIGQFNVVTETLTDHSAPIGKTSTWEGIAVTGNTDQNEHVYFVNGSGEELSGERQADGSIAYDEVTKPGGGSTIPAIDFHSLEVGRCCDTSGGVYGTTNGDEYSKIGIDGASRNFFDIDSVSADDVNVSASGGVMYRYDGNRWTPHVISDAKRGIRSVDRDGELGLAAGAEGYVYDREVVGSWDEIATPATTTLLGCARADGHPDVAVGKSGTIIERTLE